MGKGGGASHSGEIKTQMQRLSIIPDLHVNRLISHSVAAYPGHSCGGRGAYLRNTEREAGITPWMEHRSITLNTSLHTPTHQPRAIYHQGFLGRWEGTGEPRENPQGEHAQKLHQDQTCDPGAARWQRYHYAAPPVISISAILIGVFLSDDKQLTLMLKCKMRKSW